MSTSNVCSIETTEHQHPESRIWRQKPEGCSPCCHFRSLPLSCWLCSATGSWSPWRLSSGDVSCSGSACWRQKKKLLLQCLTVVIKCTDKSKVLFLGEICPFTSFNLQGVYTSLIAPLRTFWPLVWLTFQVTARGKTVKEIPDTKRKCLFWCLEYHLSFVLHFGFMHLRYRNLNGIRI